jgi:hypothetical protein
MKASVLASVAAVGLWPVMGLAASHREAPLTSLDRTADITDFFAFVSPDAPGTITSILCADPLLEPSNGPNYFPFDPGIIYEIHVDNDHDAEEDVAFTFRFQNQFRSRGVPVAFAGAGPNGVPAPAGSPPPVRPGDPVVPPAITSLDGPGAAGIGLRQTYTVTLTRGRQSMPLSRVGGGPFLAVPSNVGPRTMPNYNALFAQGVQDAGNRVRVFAGTVDDAFFIDLGAAFDSLNFRVIPGPGSTGIPGVLSDAQDKADDKNFVADDVSGYNVNCMAVQVPIELITANGRIPQKGDPLAQVGLWGTTSRAQATVRTPGRPDDLSGDAVQVQRMANPLFNELLIGTEQKDLWSRSRPSEDEQFQDSVLDPVIVRIGQAAFAAAGQQIRIPPPPRQDLGVLVSYSSGPRGPFADLLRLDLTVAPTPRGQRSRLGGCGGDGGGFPNGRRTTDDVFDCFLRVGFGILQQGFNVFPNNRLGDGVNTNDRPIADRFPFLAPAQDGRQRRHIDPGEPGCAGGICP